MKYELKESGYGKFKHLVPKRITDRKAEQLEKKGIKIYDSYKEAKREC
ncbi:MAG: hypothetical protein WC979_09085 [Candidatus Pacearchaeota archaeon]|jgi:hypothetical protein